MLPLVVRSLYYSECVVSRWEYVMEYIKKITSLLSNSVSSPAPLIEDPISVTKVETLLKLFFLIPILIQCLSICITRWLLRPESINSKLYSSVD